MSKFTVTITLQAGASASKAFDLYEQAQAHVADVFSCYNDAGVAAQFVIEEGSTQVFASSTDTWKATVRPEYYRADLSLEQREYLALIQAGIEQAKDRDLQALGASDLFHRASCLVRRIFQNQHQVQIALDALNTCAAAGDSPSCNAFERILDRAFVAARLVVDDWGYLAGPNPGPADLQEAFAELRDIESFRHLGT